ncbi:mitochondrial tRNA methylthiotransferase CDK5RAP1-like, partial [Stegodyphus dumicola]|uniref:mitochondrial tRNA methylthiotransferase CDK5RAP1-like n=1 Tax=Stegodyphus dumicola TaxID=202533 RepID=UPI0015B06486
MIRSKCFSGLFWAFSKHKYYRYVYKHLHGTDSKTEKLTTFKEKLSSGPPLSSFITKDQKVKVADGVPYLPTETINKSRKVYIETYGCQMNASDTEVVLSILQNSGFEITKDINDTDVIFIVTCAIREGAEQKIWNRLKYFSHLKAKHDLISQHSLKIGVL